MCKQGEALFSLYAVISFPKGDFFCHLKIKRRAIPSASSITADIFSVV